MFHSWCFRLRIVGDTWEEMNFAKMFAILVQLFPNMNIYDSFLRGGPRRKCDHLVRSPSDNLYANISIIHIATIKIFFDRCLCNLFLKVSFKGTDSYTTSMVLILPDNLHSMLCEI